MKSLFRLLAAGAVLLMTTSALAIPINGSIGFVGTLGLTGGPGTVTPVNATGVHFTSVNAFGGTGDYSNFSLFHKDFYTPVTFTDFIFSPNLYPNPVYNLWSLTTGTTNYSFDLFSVTVENASSNNLTLSGKGMLHMTGFDDTDGTWSLSYLNGMPSINFIAGSTAAPVPEPGTMVLLGFGLFGLAIYGKRRMNKDS